MCFAWHDLHPKASIDSGRSCAADLFKACLERADRLLGFRGKTHSEGIFGAKFCCNCPCGAVDFHHIVQCHRARDADFRGRGFERRLHTLGIVISGFARQGSTQRQFRSRHTDGRRDSPCPHASRAIRRAGKRTSSGASKVSWPSAIDPAATSGRASAPARQAVGDRRAHVGTTHLRQHRAIAIMHEAMHDRLGMHDNTELIGLDRKKW